MKCPSEHSCGRPRDPSSRQEGVGTPKYLEGEALTDNDNYVVMPNDDLLSPPKLAPSMKPFANPSMEIRGPHAALDRRVRSRSNQTRHQAPARRLFFAQSLQFPRPTHPMPAVDLSQPCTKLTSKALTAVVLDMPGVRPRHKSSLRTVCLP